MLAPRSPTLNPLKVRNPFADIENTPITRPRISAGAFSGLSVGLLGASIGIHNSLSYSAAALFMVFAAIVVTRSVRRQPRTAPRQ